MTLKHIFDKNLQEVFEQTLLKIYKSLDQTGNRDDVADMLYYLLNENESLSEERFWTLLHEEFSRDVEGKVMTIAQKLRAEGLKMGIQEGANKEKHSIAQRMLFENVELGFIAKITGLSVAQIQEVQKKMH